MNISNSDPLPGKINTGISLQRLVNHLVNRSKQDNPSFANTIINEVPEGFMVIGDENKLSPVINDLLTTIVMNARNGDIHITADRFNDIATLHIEDRNSYNGYAIASRLHCIESDARKIGGHVGVSGKTQLVSTIFFSFPSCLPLSA
jgi:hypothetical protein